MSNNLIDQAILAIGSNNIEWLKQLIDAGLDINARDELDRPLVFHADNNNSLKMLREMVALGADPDVKSTMNPGRTMLIYAVIAGSVARCQALIDCGANINLPDADHLSPLAVAITTHQANICELLIRNGADTYLDLGVNRLPAIELAMAYKDYPEVVAAIVSAAAELGVDASSSEKRKRVHL